MGDKIITIGRDEFNDICIPEKYDTVSNKHAEIRLLEDGSLCLTDYSRNGTIVNGVRVYHESRNIFYGDKILLSHSYELAWLQIERFFPKISNRDVSSNEIAHLHKARETEFYNHEAGSRDDVSKQPVTFQDERMVEIETSKYSWSWGGFLLSWIWALGHACWWPFIVVLSLFLLSIITMIYFFPMGVVFVVIQSLFHIVISIYMGIKGNVIAWENGCFENIEHFKKKEHGWTVAGIIIWAISIIISAVFVISTFLFGIALFNSIS